ncbi:hypothetical protein GPJ56_000786 [Histomonas meleagridis]|uniref:uncharacterized protein n=1 Tax=Histomonas meleagridis TaxID=135588 RepID=UPI00355A56D2|nr:hypothetical protein GPJ56_000786 [Histomonas meleagridis]KAH0804455.1 hypothetical protein GO595_003285 [Histomonas meleagridis]
MLEIDYIDSVKRYGNPVAARFADEILTKSISPIITLQTLKKAGFYEADIKTLVGIKVLLLRSHGEYNLYIPYASIVIGSLDAGRKYLVNYVKKMRSRVAERREVERRTIDNSIFYADFHVQELIGLGVFEVIRIQGRPEQISLAYDPYLGKK